MAYKHRYYAIESMAKDAMSRDYVRGISTVGDQIIAAFDAMAERNEEYVAAIPATVESSVHNYMNMDTSARVGGQVLFLVSRYVDNSYDVAGVIIEPSPRPE